MQRVFGLFLAISREKGVGMLNAHHHPLHLEVDGGKPRVVPDSHDRLRWCMLCFPARFVPWRKWLSLSNRKYYTERWLYCLQWFLGAGFTGSESVVYLAD